MKPSPIGATQTPELLVDELEPIDLDGLAARFELEDVRICAASFSNLNAGSGRLARAQLVDPGMLNDGVEPAIEPCIGLPLLEMRECALERSLQQIVRIVRVPGQAAREPAQLRQQLEDPALQQITGAAHVLSDKRASVGGSSICGQRYISWQVAKRNRAVV